MTGQVCLWTWQGVLDEHRRRAEVYPDGQVVPHYLRCQLPGQTRESCVLAFAYPLIDFLLECSQFKDLHGL